MFDKIKALAAEVNPYVVELRRHFHMYPESSLQEFETCKRIQQELTAMGIPFTVVKDIGVYADIVGAAPGKTIALRADIDALEIEEATGLPYASKNPGKMHACG
ncbi:MAG: amidohydrolase, partial [Clostridia bacterium]|nr:amidohydrolase [Clostridia bacterium]